MTARRPGVTDLLLVAAGGAAGALLRLGVDSAAPHSLFPWPTLGINVVGAFLLGMLPALTAVRRSPRWALALGPGMLGGFTTVSAWAGQVRRLADDGHVALAGTLVVATLAAGLLAAALGQHLARRAAPSETWG